jgi:hypothetical protein
MRTKLQLDLEKAGRLLSGFKDEGEGRRLKRVLEMTVFSSGLATELFLADSATEGAPPELAKALNEAASLVRQSYDARDRETLAEQSRLLKALVAQIRDQRAGVALIGDREDYGGLLRLLGQ